MEENVSYTTDKSLIDKDNMHLTVTNCRPQFLNQAQTEIKREIETQLYRIFQKYA